uniref:Alliinase EGF-like domain-containing protein n=1 Tax=Vitis vinifera TaxID=29760 RepID=F6H6R3_VITVI
MAKIQISIYVGCLACSVILNVLLLSNYVYVGGKGELSWSRRAAEEAEAVAAVSCSGHGRGYLDGLVVDGSPVCECNSCFGGPDCSQFAPDCVADADRRLSKQGPKVSDQVDLDPAHWLVVKWIWMYAEA